MPRYLEDPNFRLVRRPQLLWALARLFDAPPKGAWKLSECAKRDIARRYRAGQRVVDIAAIYGIAPQNVSRHAHVRGIPKRKPRRRWR